jgi:ABC-type multidrug transport system fused ATPase/permease subunit
MNVNEAKVIAYIGLPPLAVYLTGHGINLNIINGLAAVMLLDIVTAVIMWLRVDPSQIKSRVLKAGLTEKFASLIPAIIVFIVLLALDQQAAGLVNGYLTILLIAEAYSAISNAHNAYMKEVKEEYDAVSAVLAAVRKRVFNWLQKLLRTFVDEDGQDNARKN